MADIQYWDDVLSNEIDEIHKLMDNIQGMSNDERKAVALREVEQKLKAANGTKKSLKMETRLVTDVNQRKQYESRLSRLNEELSHQNADLVALKQDLDRQTLLGDRHGSGAQINEEDAVKAGDEMLSQAHKMQDNTQESLDVTKQLVAESKEVGLSTLQELKKQRETLDRIDKETDRIDSALDRAEKLVKHFGKRMASDRFIQCFTAVNVLMLVAVIVYSIFRDGSLTGGDNAPENPLGSAPLTGASGGGRMLRQFLRSG